MLLSDLQQAMANPAVPSGFTDAHIQDVVNSGLPVKLLNGQTYSIANPIIPPAGVVQRIYSEASPAGGATLEAVSGFTGFMLSPVASYDLRNFYLQGSGVDGCYGIGTLGTFGAGRASIDNVYLANCDLPIYFGPNFQHPAGMYYNKIATFNTRSGGISITGPSGGTSGGESNWSFDNIFCSNNGINGIVASSIVITTNTPDSTHDTIAWNNSVTPIYGWVVLRSPDGSTAWQVPPNWGNNSQLNAASFVAQKNAGETWFYTVVRQTLGLCVRRAKAVMMGSVQSEYFGLGLWAQDVTAMTIGALYDEQRIPSAGSTPRPNIAAAWFSRTSASLVETWCEGTSYAAVIADNSNVMVSGGQANNCFVASIGMGGSTAQLLRGGMIEPTGTTPAARASITPGGSIYDHSGQFHSWNPTTNAFGFNVDAAGTAGLYVNQRGVLTCKLETDPVTNVGTVTAGNARITPTSKTIAPMLTNINSATRTALTSGSATAIATIDASGIGAQANISLDIDYLIKVSDSSSVCRQTAYGLIKIAIMNTAGVTTAGVTVIGGGTLLSTGTLTVTFATSVSGNVVTVSCTATTSISTPTLALRPLVPEQLGDALVTVTQQ